MTVTIFNIKSPLVWTNFIKPFTGFMFEFAILCAVNVSVLLQKGTLCTLVPATISWRGQNGF